MDGEATVVEIWRHEFTGKRCLVVVRDGLVTVAAGPLWPGDDPRLVVATHGNQELNPRALLHMNQARNEYVREYVRERKGTIVHLGNEPEPRRGAELHGHH
jgi:hypothetical protein